MQRKSNKKWIQYFPDSILILRNIFRFVVKLLFGFDRKSVITDSVQDLLIWNERMIQEIRMQKIETFMHPSVPDGHPLKEHILYRE